MRFHPVSRLRLLGGIHHVTLRGAGGRSIVRNPEDARQLDGLVGELLHEHGARAHAYCWMTNHLHLVLEIRPPAAGAFAASLANGYSAVSGKDLFSAPGRPLRFEPDAYLLPLVRYVHRNPLRAGLVRDPADWPWSGHRAYLGYDRPCWLSTDLCFRLLGGDLLRASAAYRALAGPRRGA